jgi:U3 small nucleolar RNA-associated protein 21
MWCSFGKLFFLKENGNDSQNDSDSMDIDDTYKNYKSPEQLANELITLSLLPESRWKNLVDLDIIKVINYF